MACRSELQLDLFEKCDESTFLRKEMDDLFNAQHNLRRGIFARINDMGKLMIKQQEEIEALQRQFMMVAKSKK
jgi:hypothetical protein